MKKFGSTYAVLRVCYGLCLSFFFEVKGILKCTETVQLYTDYRETLWLT